MAWEKCKAYILEFILENGEKSMAHTKDTQPPLEIFDIFHQQFYQILLATPDTAFKMLGAFVAPKSKFLRKKHRLGQTKLISHILPCMKH